MGTVPEKDGTLDAIWRMYDPTLKGYLTAEEVQAMHEEMRINSISLPQVKASIEYSCVTDVCEKSELFGLLQEMDRRYFLLQDFRWEFSMLDTDHSNTITEEKAKWFMKAVHGKYFSRRKWEKFLRSRALPGSGVYFHEIEVGLCNIPNRLDLLAEEEEDRREEEELERKRRELEKAALEEKERLRKKRDLERRMQDAEERRRQEEEARRRDQEEDERRKRQREKEEAELKRRRLQEEEERGRREAEERERQERQRKQEEEEKRRKQREQEELLEARRMKDELERKQKEEEERRRREAEEALEAEKILQRATKEEQDAEEKAKKARDAKEKEKQKLRAKDARHRRIRYNLKVAIKRRDRERLPPAVDEFKKAKLPDTDMDLPKAERILLEFKAGDGLKKAMTQRQLQELERAINFIKKNGFEPQFAKELIEANRLLLQLRRLERIRAEILELKQSTVAEIRSYQKPPTIVHTVMTSTFLLLGHKEKETKVWKNVQALVGKTGKEGLKRRCLGLEPDMINPDAAKRASELNSHFDLDDVRDVSAGAATFYVWTMTMIEELDMRLEAKKREAEEKKREAEEKKKRLEEEKRIKEEVESEQDGEKNEEGEGPGGAEGGAD